MALQKVVHILCNAGGISAVLSYTLPKRKQEVCRILVLEQEVDFINEDKGLLTFSTVLCNTVQNRVEDDKHTDRHKLLAEVKNVITDKSVIRINIGWLCKGIQRTVSKQLDSKGDFLCFRLVLFQKLRTKILQGRNSTGISSLLIVSVNTCRTTVDDRFLLCSEVCTADKLFAKGHNELGFQDNRVCSVAVFLVHIHRIDMARRSSGNIDYFAAESFYKLRILSLRVYDNNICIGGKNDIFNFTLCRKGFSAAGYAENKRVAVE